MDTLREAFKNCSDFIGGNGPRTVSVLMEALKDVDPSIESDMYGKGQWISSFEKELASEAGMEDGVFFPSGTMAQQIGLRIACDQRQEMSVAYHPLCHLEIHEQHGLHELHHIKAHLLGDRDRMFTLEDVKNLEAPIAALLVELPQRELGGFLPSYDELVAISDYCRTNHIHLHLDGARLFEVLPYYGKSIDDICRLFDSVYLSFYKGIGGIAGAILLGSQALCDEARIWKRRHGGDLISLYPYIISAKYYMDKRRPLMPTYYEKAKELAKALNTCPKIATRPHTPVSNMFHVYLDEPKEKVIPFLVDLYKKTGIGMTGYLTQKGEHECFFEVSVGDSIFAIDDVRLQAFIKSLNHL